MPTTNLPNLISNLKDLLKVWRKTENGGIAISQINHLMLRKFGTSINPATFGFGTLHAFLDYLGKCGHIKLEFRFVKLTIMGLVTNPTSFSTMMLKLKSLAIFPVKKKIRKLNQLGFSLRMKM